MILRVGNYFMTGLKRNVSPVSIFLDLDGVVADFDSHADACAKKTPDGKMNWEALDFQWWVTMPAFAGAKKFYDDLKNLAPVKFLTAPVLSEDCFSGKAKWVQNFVPEKGRWILMDLIICPSQDKRNLAKSGAILIDDREKNVREWVEAGGIGVHHTGDFTKTFAEVKKAVDKLTPPKSGFFKAAKPLKP